MSTNDAAEPDLVPSHLFVYGTLGPATPEEAAQGGFLPDRLQGFLYDLGPYPALIALDDPGAPWVDGHVRPVSHAELVDLLDPYEGVHEDLFHRRATHTQNGLAVWVYVFARPLPAGAKGPLHRWQGRRIDPRFSPRPDLPES